MHNGLQSINALLDVALELKWCQYTTLVEAAGLSSPDVVVVIGDLHHSSDQIIQVLHHWHLMPAHQGHDTMATYQIECCQLP
jgi:hypothetical protein